MQKQIVLLLCVLMIGCAFLPKNGEKDQKTQENSTEKIKEESVKQETMTETKQEKTEKNIEKQFLQEKKQNQQLRKSLDKMNGKLLAIDQRLQEAQNRIRELESKKTETTGNKQIDHKLELLHREIKELINIQKQAPVEKQENTQYNNYYALWLNDYLLMQQVKKIVHEIDLFILKGKQPADKMQLAALLKMCQTTFIEFSGIYTLKLLAAREYRIQNKSNKNKWNILIDDFISSRQHHLIALDSLLTALYTELTMLKLVKEHTQLERKKLMLDIEKIQEKLKKVIDHYPNELIIDK